MPLPTVEPGFNSTVIAIAKVGEVEVQSEDEKSKVVSVRVKVDGYNPAPSASLWLQYHPIFFDASFQPNNLTQYEGGDKLLEMYEQNLTTSERGQTANLLGLVNGDRKRFEEITDEFQRIGSAITADEFTGILREFLIDRAYGSSFGTVFRQQQKPYEDANGERKYRKTPFYNIDNRVSREEKKIRKGFWVNNEKGRKYQISRVSKSTEVEPISGKPWYVVSFNEDGTAAYGNN